MELHYNKESDVFYTTQDTSGLIMRPNNHPWTRNNFVTVLNTSIMKDIWFDDLWLCTKHALGVKIADYWYDKVMRNFSDVKAISEWIYQYANLSSNDTDPIVTYCRDRSGRLTMMTLCYDGFFWKTLCKAIRKTIISICINEKTTDGTSFVGNLCRRWATDQLYGVMIGIRNLESNDLVRIEITTDTNNMQKSIDEIEEGFDVAYDVTVCNHDKVVNRGKLYDISIGCGYSKDLIALINASLYMLCGGYHITNMGLIYFMRWITVDEKED